MLRILTLIFLLSPLCALAQSPEPEKEDQFTFITQSKELKHTFSGRIDKVIDEQTILLKGNKIVRLTGLDIPSHSSNPDFDYKLKAKNWLEKNLPEGREVKIYQTRKAEKGRKNRMEHELGHILTKDYKQQNKEVPPFWVQGTLLSQGLARVYTAPSNPQLHSEMLSIEQQARKEKSGLWAKDSPFHMITPNQAEELVGQFVVLEGKIVNASSVNNKLYLNFGDNWRNDFTVQLSTALRRKLSRQAINPTGLSGETVRVRGWLREYNGPFLELETLEHLEILKENSPLPEQVKGARLAQ